MRFARMLIAAGIVGWVGLGGAEVDAQSADVARQSISIASGSDATADCRSNQLQVSADGGATFVAAYVVKKAGLWAFELGDSRWVSHGHRDPVAGGECSRPPLTTDARVPMPAPNVFRYRYDFDLPADAVDIRFEDLAISFDNEVDIRLNGVPASLLRPPPKCEQRPDGTWVGLECDKTSFLATHLVDRDELTASLAPGPNTLEFTLRDFGGVAGMMFDGRVTFESDTPTQPQGRLGLVKRSTTDVIVAAGQRVDYAYDVTNLGTGTVTGISVVDDNVDTDGVTCPSDELAEGAAMTCTANRTVTPADLAEIDAATIPEGISCSLRVLSVDGDVATYGYYPPDNIPRSFWVDGVPTLMLPITVTVAPVPSDGTIGYPDARQLVDFDDLTRCPTATMANTATARGDGTEPVSVTLEIDILRP